MVCQCRLIDYNRCTTLMGDFDNGQDYACMKVQEVPAKSVLSTQFCHEKLKLLKKVVSNDNYTYYTSKLKAILLL